LQLRELIECGANIVVAGATAAGKTTLLNALLNSAPPSQRIVTCEEVFELRLFAPDWVAMQTRPAGVDGGGAITLRHLVKEALRMRPDRLVIGEVRGAESLDLLIAMNSGLPSMCSIHANSASAAREKLSLLPLLAGSNVSADFASRAVATAVDAIVFISNRKVREIVIA
jgi:pilus assembly protein CpaF